MTPTEVTTILKHLDGWPVQHHSTKKVQEAIDSAVEMIERLEAAEKERDKYKTAYNEWCEKSEWIQEGINKREISPKYLGWHLADIALDLLKEHKEKCDALRAEIEHMERDLRLIAETDPVDAALDPQRAVRIARAALEESK